MKKILVVLSFLSLSSLASHSSTTYDCRILKKYDDGTFPKTFRLGIAGDSIVISNPDGDENRQEDTGTRDPNYKPHKSNAGSQLFPGEYHNSFNSSDERYDTELSINHALVERSKTGYLRVRARGEGYASASYRCIRVDQ